MIEQVITYKLAKLAKEKGFNFPTLSVYGYSGYQTMRKEENWNASEVKSDSYSAPTQSLLQKWLREIHNIKVMVNSSSLNGNKKWVDWIVSVQGICIIDHRNGVDSYEEALEIGLQEALKLIE